MTDRHTNVSYYYKSTQKGQEMPRGCQVACFLADIARVDLWYASLLHTFVASDPPEKEVPKTEVHKKCASR